MAARERVLPPRRRLAGLRPPEIDLALSTCGTLRSRPAGIRLR